MNKLIFLAINCLLFAGPLVGQENKDSLITARIEMVQSENLITFRPTVQNEGDYHYELDYLLLVKKRDANKNLSINQQRGRFTLEPREVKSLSVNTVNQEKDQHITATLFIRDEVENKLITKDSIVFQSSNNVSLRETALSIMSGIVVDETKTKIGRDFYDIFYSIYNQYPQKFEFIIQILEMPYRGLSSVIQIKVDQEIISEFLVNPDEEYLKQQTNFAFRRLTTYANQRGSIKNEFKY